MQLDTSIEVLPILHGRAEFSRQLRSICLSRKFDCIAVDLPGVFEPFLTEAVEALPIIETIVARDRATEKLFYLPIDPCDATIEAIRQSFQYHIPFFTTGYPSCVTESPLPELPDEYALATLGSDVYQTLCLKTIAATATIPTETLHARYGAHRLHTLRTRYRSLLAVMHLRNIPGLYRCYHNEQSHNATFPEPPSYEILTAPINPDHLYFALGELPCITGKYEKERYDPCAAPFNPVESVKELFCETRDESRAEPDAALPLSPVRLQAALTFLRNMTIMSGRLLPSLFDIVEAAKGVGGNSFALRILKHARYYPWLPIVDSKEMIGIGTTRIRVPPWDVTTAATNLFADFHVTWKRLSLQPDPSLERKKKYRYNWNPYGMCSHIPEDLIIEHFNSTVRSKARKQLSESHASVEKFSTSVMDGIDIRETLRNWHQGDIYVKIMPPIKGTVDSVVIIFDADHDEKYTNCTTWYAEHAEESTLSFYATDPFENLLGPGIARCYYGGLSLLFPPRPIPDIFTLETSIPLPNLAARLTLGACLFSREKVIAYVARRKPNTVLTQLARRCNKRLTWIPLATFSHETVHRLQCFHILNGKNVRSWARRFIGH